MKTVIICIALLFLSACGQQTISYKEIEHRTDASKDVVKEFSKKLKGELQTAMKSGGPIAAIKVCNEQATLIAQELSKKLGWDIHRTSLKPRATKPDAWEKRMMLAFEKQREKGDEYKRLFVQDITEANGKPAFRYMQAIETKKVCLVCHGENIAPAIATKIQELYPQDTATGFKLGDIRGAFSIIQPLNQE
jgi:hypothetical protein